MTNELATMTNKAIEVLATGNLAKLTDAEKTQHYRAVCESLGMNPLTRPFEYLTLNGKLALYARKDATDQLRKLNGISIKEPVIRFEDQWIIVTVIAHDSHGRTDSDIGVVAKSDMQGNFGNALMKAVTKSKRRVTLSICGLGMLDETEVETIPSAQHGGNHPQQVPAPVVQQPKPADQPAGGQHQSPPAASAIYTMLSATLRLAVSRDDLAKVKATANDNRGKMSQLERDNFRDELKMAEEEVTAAEAERSQLYDGPANGGMLPD